MKRFLAIAFSIIFGINSFSQTEEEQIINTLKNYIEGTSFNQTKTIQKAFYKDANLYLSHPKKDIWIVPISEYQNWFDNKNKGKFNGRIGNIISIDFFQDIATAKAEILIPEKETRFIDLFLLKKINNHWKIISKTASKEKSKNSGNKILFIVSNAHFHGKSDLPTGNSFYELISAFETFKNAGFTVDFVSPNGKAIPIAYINTSNLNHKKYLYNFDFMYALKNTKSPKEITPKEYKAVHYIGGGSAMYGVPENKEIQKIAMEIYEKYGGIISSVCHGTAGIVHLKTSDGKFLVDGKNISGYPDSYEKYDAEYYQQFPFKIQQTIEKRGGKFQYSPRNTAHVESDQNVITGQNYLSSKYVALKIIEELNKQK
ncbi:nuclear transport factor 2 family protein [Aureivirga marina]|uniref:nuclear transport factor 2 family protein n=1 Tax=Aureivirga marina TaxID=1182451 RepID=UPI0018CA8F8A|nr:nuclear transport factor 2 family protein [Aureivirga marina]